MSRIALHAPLTAPFGPYAQALFVVNKIPSVLGPQWLEMVQLACVTWMRSKCACSSIAARTSSTSCPSMPECVMKMSSSSRSW